MTRLGVFATIKDKIRGRYNENKQEREKLRAINEAIREEAKKVGDEEYFKEKSRVEIEAAKERAKLKAMPMHKRLGGIGDGMSGILDGLVGKPEPEKKGKKKKSNVDTFLFGEDDSDSRSPHQNMGDLI